MFLENEVPVLSWCSDVRTHAVLKCICKYWIFLDDYIETDFPVFVQDMIIVSVNIRVRCVVFKTMKKLYHSNCIQELLWDVR